MRKKIIVLTPLPQFQFGSKALARAASRFKMGNVISIRALRPRLRRALLDTVKTEKPTDDLLMLLNESELVFIAEVPARRHKGSQDSIMFPLLYSWIATKILDRLHDCFLLFDWVPSSIFSPWFSGKASANYTKITDLNFLNPSWEYVHEFTCIDWRSPIVEPVDIGPAYFQTHMHWTNLSRLCHVEQLEKIFRDPNKEKGIIESAQEYAKGRVEEFIRTRYPDATIDWSDGHINNANTGPLNMSRHASRWIIDGLSDAIDQELDKISDKLHKNVSKNRLVRAFQFFCEAFRLTQPHRFLIFSVCLEALLSTRRTEIVFQLASRLGWLLEPKDYYKRREIFKETTQLYDLRSKIVHGVNFSISEVEAREERLIELCRRVFWKVLSDNKLFETFFGRDAKVCDEYLDSLNLGCAESAGA